jgi:hypothetical protein
MRLPVLSVRNREALRADRELYPSVEACVATIVDRRLIQGIQKSEDRNWGDSDWLIFRDEHGAGFGLCGNEVSAAGTIQSTLKQATALWKVGKVLRGRSESPLTWSDDGAPPSDWIVFKVVLLHDEMWCAISTPSPSIPGVLPPQQSLASVRARVLGSMPVTDVPLVGGSISFDTLTVRVTEFDMEGVLQFDKGGTMTLEITATIGNEKDTPVPGVRIDLGELEIALQDLLALKPGEVIALGPLDPMACHLRVGSSVIARGELRQGEEGAVISITHVS